MGRVIHTGGIIVALGLLALVGACTPSSRATAAAEPAPEAITPSSPVGLEQHGFTVRDFRAIRDEYGQVSVVGEIENTGSTARGVELQATLRNTAGRVLAVGHFCPASYTDIEPGEVWPFTYSFDHQEKAAKAELRIVGAFRTMDVVNVWP